MTQPVTLSVRGEARVETGPDTADIHVEIRADERSRAAVLRTVAQRRDAVLHALRDLGGRAAEAGERVPLSWIVNAPTSYAERRWDDRKVETLTGRDLATVAVRVRVRDFALLDAVEAALARHEAASITHVGWTVDQDNAAWRAVRTEAIEAALQRGRDYAAALGGTLERIEQIADAGLLGHSTEGRFVAAQAMSLSAGEGSSGLVPTPQQLSAVIEARLVALVTTLAGGGPHVTE